MCIDILLVVCLFTFHIGCTPKCVKKLGMEKMINGQIDDANLLEMVNCFYVDPFKWRDLYCVIYIYIYIYIHIIQLYIIT